MEEEESTISKGSLSEDVGRAGWGGAAGGGTWCGGIGWAMYREIAKKGVVGSKKGLKRGTTKSRRKKIYRQNLQVAIMYNESIT